MDDEIGPTNGDNSGGNGTDPDFNDMYDPPNDGNGGGNGNGDGNGNGNGNSNGKTDSSSNG